MAIHLQSLSRQSAEKARARAELDAMLHELAQLKAELDRRRALLALEDAA